MPIIHYYPILSPNLMGSGEASRRSTC